MIEFKKITIESKAEIQHYTLVNGERNCDFSFANLCSWSFRYHTEYAIAYGFLLIRFYMEGKPVYMMPVGEGDWPALFLHLKEEALQRESEFRMLGISPRWRIEMEQILPDTFLFESDRNYADYLYLRSDLATLRGKRFQAKRNHVNRFRKTFPHYEYRPLTPEWVPECLRLEEKWCIANGCNEQVALLDERRSMQYALMHLTELDIVGGVLLVDGNLVAFTYGAAINQDTWDVCVEKANTEIEGAYAVINYEYANHIDEKYVYINREEDLGLEGLRKAKLSYQPFCLLEKYSATLV